MQHMAKMRWLKERAAQETPEAKTAKPKKLAKPKQKSKPKAPAKPVEPTPIPLAPEPQADESGTEA